jgi:hypothetical protein
MTPRIKIKPHETAPRTFVTDILVSFCGQKYLSRVPYLVSDTPEQRALHGQLFMKRHNARVAEDHYSATVSAVDVAMSFDAAKKADSIIGFAKAGGPPSLPGKRPALRLI